MTLNWEEVNGPEERLTIQRWDKKKCTRFNKDKVLQLEQTHVTVKTVDRLCGKQLCGRGSGGAGAQQAEQEPAGDCIPAATKADTSWTASARVLPADQGM